MRVLTYNVLAEQYADGGARYERIAEGLRELDADVIALQEVPIERVADLVGEGYALAPHPNTDDDGIGACLASRFPVRAVHVVDLHVTERSRGFPWAGAVVAELDTPLGPVVVVNHKPNWAFGLERERELQAVATVRFLERYPDSTPLVLLGDLDATPDAASIRFLTGKQSLDGVSTCFQDAWAAVHDSADGFTFTPENPLVHNGDMPLDPGRRIDYVMVRSGSHGPGLEVAACDRAFDRPRRGRWCSDHFAVVADLRRPARAPGSTQWLREFRPA
ncbi:endonuclease/exonuclease/phosphatase family protein [Labedaea rhizosphaerae]|uniref:Endonuclease/exonuclease/phosphatase family metal-dependent hydrolase n=1 Tax=Labedaea rhizosphaerae TaxID=598644 RepID=A0A4R6SGQ7_LABRH|nr:endonuclease/exonuclease/phosphatase family protein [Labedaea rhizosphaerae]TDQ00904.1 endonuclease/exonuclease/phosphatase family metal-dependent hydrolase [Labedaea rhizosphaerae]